MSDKEGVEGGSFSVAMEAHEAPSAGAETICGFLVSRRSQVPCRRECTSYLQSESPSHSNVLRRIFVSANRSRKERQSARSFSAEQEAVEA